jgi:hypothetical protein
MSTSQFAKIFGIVTLLLGILGFVPGITTDQYLLGIFHVDTVHNVVHILTGLLALMLAGSSAKMFFKIFGLVYLLVAIVGFVQGDTVLGLMGNNMADTWLHVVIAAVALYFGFRKE